MNTLCGDVGQLREDLEKLILRDFGKMLDMKITKVFLVGLLLFLIGCDSDLSYSKLCGEVKFTDRETFDSSDCLDKLPVEKKLKIEKKLIMDPNFIFIEGLDKLSSLYLLDDKFFFNKKELILSKESTPFINRFVTFLAIEDDVHGIDFMHQNFDINYFSGCVNKECQDADFSPISNALMLSSINVLDFLYKNKIIEWDKFNALQRKLFLFEALFSKDEKLLQWLIDRRYNLQSADCELIKGIENYPNSGDSGITAMARVKKHKLLEGCQQGIGRSENKSMR